MYPGTPMHMSSAAFNKVTLKNKVQVRIKHTRMLLNVLTIKHTLKWRMVFSMCKK